MRAVLGGRDALGSAPITVGTHALIHHNVPSGEAGKRDQAQNEGQFRKDPGQIEGESKRYVSMYQLGWAERRSPDLGGF